MAGKRSMMGHMRMTGMLAALIIWLLLVTACPADVREQPKRQTPDVTSRHQGLPACETAEEKEKEAAAVLYPEGKSIEERFQTPPGYARVPAEQGSFGEYLRRLPVKEHGSEVKLYNGQTKARQVYESVVDMDIGSRDLQQCADAVIRLRSEYLYGKGAYDKIHYNFTNGFCARFSRWVTGERISVKGNTAAWVKKTKYSDSYATFRQFLDMVFAYAGTLSLSREMVGVPLEDMKIGDVFMKGDLPGHCVIVVDMAENMKTGDKLFMVAQSYMPAQDIHILKNEEHSEMSPWYPLRFGERLETPEWSFDKDQLMRFSEE